MSHKMNLNGIFNPTFCKGLKNITKFARLKSFLRTKERFYDAVSVKESDELFFIQLDGKTVKTPLKNDLYAPTKKLAQAVMTEWSSQRCLIKPHQMHLTALCNTCIDNPQNLSTADIVENTLSYLQSETICARTPIEESHLIFKVQQDKWDPVLEWFNKRFSVDVQCSTELFGLEQSRETIDCMKHVLSQFNKWQLAGLQFSVDSLKSFVIPLAVIERHLTLEDALYLARLEVEIQTEKWGSVEWCHEAEHANQMAHLSAGVLFHQLCSGLNIE